IELPLDISQKLSADEGENEPLQGGEDRAGYAPTKMRRALQLAVVERDARDLHARVAVAGGRLVAVDLDRAPDVEIALGKGVLVPGAASVAVDRDVRGVGGVGPD